MIAPLFLMITAAAETPPPPQRATVQIVASVTIIAAERIDTQTRQPTQQRGRLDRTVRLRGRAIIVEYY